ncbi:epidermal growth factor receptor substrate 15 isoform X1 [Rhodamnia argentea]|uniref:Epidermal growth factor receptor substrate 15 isoform X1 n=1 Tax=Rhodamnia argentea TaxID=178133 RepID=A0A8B8NXQ4_9MYRT|nr:epidermal growth factor receptor substrate 15 isoform X1 [Rhodamnia argentea]
MAGSMEQFEAYFRRADLDGDGRISGAEAVAFFQGSNLPKHVLAQIWMHADQAHTGFLGRAEFYNALKLVTVAQSKRELTADIVKAALYGPAAAKIPPPQINLSAIPAPHGSTTAVAATPPMRATAQPASPSFGFGFPSQQQQQPVRPPQPMPAPTAFRAPQANAGSQFPMGSSLAGPGVPNTNMSSDWTGGRSGGVSVGSRDTNSSVLSALSKPQTLPSLSPQAVASDSKAVVVPGNGSSPDSFFGGDLFSAKPSPSKQESSALTNPTVSAPLSSAITPVSGGQPSVKPNALDALQTSFSELSSSSQVQRPPMPSNPREQVPSLGSSSFASPGISVVVANSSSSDNQLNWPKMKPSDVQKYTKVFMEVDTDRDGKITGEQARNLFLSWRLPREVLKQVWDLSDQDSDSMLSLREFCFALYMMERHREGRPLPTALPSNVMYDETLLSMTGLPNVAYGNAAWGASSGFRPQQGMPGARPLGPATGLRPGMQVPTPKADAVKQTNQHDLRGPALGDPFANVVGNIEQNSVGSAPQEVATGEKKVEEKKKVILDSKEKIEFYRTKMQDLVLFKSRCDNKLNEITERASADKREAELLGKKYEEKYKQVAEIASKLTIEEATFRELQERKMELHKAIITVEQGGSADGLLQVRADRIQSDIDELMKALTERCKKHGLDVKSTALFELPNGWQPGIQEGAAVWDEDWDKFDDEGFVNDLNLDGKNVSVTSKTKSASVERENASTENGYAHDSISNPDEKPRNSLGTMENTFEDEFQYAHSEDESARSPHESPVGRTSAGSPSQVFSDAHFEKSPEADAETHRSFDESTWGAFDNNDDVDSVWGFGSKELQDSKHEDYSFSSSDYGVNPIRTGSPQADNAFQTRSGFAFDDSVPATPLSRFGNSSPRYSEAGDHYYDNFSRFDSFRTHDSGLYPQQPERLTRFDSINSTKDFGHSRGFSSFDDSDPFGSSGPFKVSSENPTSKKSSDNWNAF